MNETTALTNTTTVAINDQTGKQKRGYMPWIALTVVLLGLAAFYSAGPRRRANKLSEQRTYSCINSHKLPSRLNLKCNPSEQNGDGPSGCDNEDCADPVWEDGCKGCMCFNTGNPTWCDGTRNEYYDDYFDQHGMNPWGDQNRENRKCNTFLGDDDDYTFVCNNSWQCKSRCCAYVLTPSSNNRRCTQQYH